MASKLPRTIALSAVLVLLLAGCIDRGEIADIATGGGDQAPSPTHTLEDEGLVGDAFCPAWDAAGHQLNPQDNTEHVTFDPDALGHWGITGLPAKGCHEPINLRVTSVEWRLNDPGFCEKTTDLLTGQMNAAGYTTSDTISETGGDYSPDISLQFDNGDDVWVNWQCWKITASDLALFEDLLVPAKIGQTHAFLVGNDVTQSGAG